MSRFLGERTFQVSITKSKLWYLGALAQSWMRVWDVAVSYLHVGTIPPSASLPYSYIHWEIRHADSPEGRDGHSSRWDRVRRTARQAVQNTQCRGPASQFLRFGGFLPHSGSETCCSWHQLRHFHQSSSLLKESLCHIIIHLNKYSLIIKNSMSRPKMSKWLIFMW